MEPCGALPLAWTTDSWAFTPVAGEPPLVRAVRSVLGHVAVGRFVVAAAPTLGAAARDCLSSAGLASVAVAVAREPGSRQQALVAALEHLGIEPHSSTPVIVADHGHPLTPGAVTGRVIAGLRGGYDVVVPAQPVTDTIKTIDEHGSVLGTVDRAALRTVQYPRAYTACALWELVAHSAIPPADDLDEFVAALRAGLVIGTVDGDADAGAVELPRDAELFEAIITCG